jgi:hypothetical protein
MASRGSAQSKLDKVVDLIAEAMTSEVCSIYLLRDNSSSCSRPTACARKRCTSPGWRWARAGRQHRRRRAHPQSRRGRQPPEFVYRPETGEESFHSFAGRADRPAGKPDRRARRPARRPAPLRRCRDRGAADRRDGAVGDDRRGAAGRRRAARRAARAPARCACRGSSWSPAWPRARRCSTSRG